MPTPRQFRVCLAGEIDHHRRQVDAEDIQPQVPQVRGDTSSAASQLGDGPGIGGPRELGERSEHRAIQRESVKLIADEFGVTEGDGIVGVSHAGTRKVPSRVRRLEPSLSC
ncbi:hypothetical protein [Streptomyces xantholiticus]|uniref:hypothetical protein n=1 Tax=Streptomyces xantholiticus TaxID=68285 RepID=UPI003D9FA4D8